jgi:hypothetical protein
MIRGAEAAFTSVLMAFPIAVLTVVIKLLGNLEER